MANFPTVKNPATITDLQPEDPAIRTELENGQVQTRARYTRMRRSWTLAWANMTNADYQLMFSHYVAQKGGSDSFTWTNPMNNTEYTVRYKEFSSGKAITPTIRTDFSVTLEEV